MLPPNTDIGGNDEAAANCRCCLCDEYTCEHKEASSQNDEKEDTAGTGRDTAIMVVASAFVNGVQAIEYMVNFTIWVLSRALSNEWVSLLVEPVVWAAHNIFPVM